MYGVCVCELCKAYRTKQSLVTGKPLISLTEHNDVVTCLTVDAAELVLATGSADSTICVWDLPSIVKATSSGFVPAALTNTVTSLLVKETVSPVKLMHEKQASSTDTSAAAYAFAIVVCVCVLSPSMEVL